MNKGNILSISQFHNKNQHFIRYENGIGLQSYESLVVVQSEGETYLGKNWDYSRTTRKHVSLFLGEDCKTIKYKLENKIYKEL